MATETGTASPELICVRRPSGTVRREVTDRMAGLQITGVIDDRVRIAQRVGRMPAHVVAYRIGVPHCFGQRPPHPVR